MTVSRSFYRIICLLWWMTALGLVGLLISLAGCASGYTKDGTTVVSYCLLGGALYVDDTKAEMTHETKHKTCIGT